MAWTIEDFQSCSVWDLRDVCEEYGVNLDSIDIYDLFDADYLSEHIQELARSCRWEEITDELAELNWNGDNGEAFYYDYGVVKEFSCYDLPEAREEILRKIHEQGAHLEGEEGYEEEEEPVPDYNPTRYVNPVCKRELYGSVRVDGGWYEAPSVNFSDADFVQMIGG